MWGKVAKNMGFIDFSKRRTGGKHFQEILVSRDTCTIFFLNSTLHAWENQSHENLFRDIQNRTVLKETQKDVCLNSVCSISLIFLLLLVEGADNPLL